MRTSPGYYLLTGRKGFWLIEHGDSHFIAAIHPNTDDCLLLFPTEDSVDTGACVDVARHFSDEFSDIRLSRILREQKKQFQASGYFTQIEEDILDWKCPVVILDNAKLSALAGSGYASLRNKLNKFRRSAIRVIDNRSEEYRHRSDEVERMIHQWATEVSGQKNFRTEHLADSNLHGYNQALRQLDHFNGYLVECDKRIVALYTSEVIKGQLTANGITLCIDRSIQGVAEFTYWWTCRKHLQQGYQWTNINGAETESLHTFRLKLCPSSTIHLLTFLYTPSPAVS